jgi:hypothetical protein
MRKELQWYKDRIGKKVFRVKNICQCDYCLKYSREGMIIHNELHANYLYEVQNDTNHNYQDTPIEKTEK